MSLPRPGFRTWLALLLLALGAGLALLDLHESGTPEQAPGATVGEPDFYLESTRLTRYDAQGRPHQRVTTPRLVHTPEDDVTRLEAPRIRLHDDAGRLWVAEADKGTLGPGGNPLSLDGNARLEAPAERWELETQAMHYDADTSHAWSTTPATLRQPPQRMSGDRFDAWLNDNRARLTDNVRGHHPPETLEESSP